MLPDASQKFSKFLQDDLDRSALGWLLGGILWAGTKSQMGPILHLFHGTFLYLVQRAHLMTWKALVVVGMWLPRNWAVKLLPEEWPTEQMILVGQCGISFAKSCKMVSPALLDVLILRDSNYSHRKNYGKIFSWVLLFPNSYKILWAVPRLRFLGEFMIERKIHK